MGPNIFISHSLATQSTGLVKGKLAVPGNSIDPRKIIIHCFRYFHRRGGGGLTYLLAIPNTTYFHLKDRAGTWFATDNLYHGHSKSFPVVIIATIFSKNLHVYIMGICFHNQKNKQ